MDFFCRTRQWSYDVSNKGTLADFIKAFDAETKEGTVYHLEIEKK
jgi:hypothetical protein